MYLKKKKKKKKKCNENLYTHSSDIREELVARAAAKTETSLIWLL